MNLMPPNIYMRINEMEILYLATNMNCFKTTTNKNCHCNLLTNSIKCNSLLLNVMHICSIVRKRFLMQKCTSVKDSLPFHRMTSQFEDYDDFSLSCNIYKRTIAIDQVHASAQPH